MMPSGRLHALASQANDEMAESLRTIKRRTAEIWKVPQHQFYTGHDESHAERVIEHLEDLTAQGELNQAEAYVLLAAAYLHDVGMQVQQAGRTPEEVREIHEKLAAEWVIRSVQPGSRQDESLGVLRSYALPLAQVILGHRAKGFEDPAFRDYPVGHHQIRVAFLSALLQLADELEIDRRRVAMDRLRFVDVPTSSQVHWYGHDFILAVVVRQDSGSIQIVYGFPPGHEQEYTTLIAAPIQRLIGGKFDYLSPELARNHVHVTLPEPQINPDPTASILPSDVLIQLQRAATLASLSQQERQRAAVLMAQQEMDALVKSQVEEAHRRRDAGEAAQAAQILQTVAETYERRGYNAGAALYYEEAAELRAGLNATLPACTLYLAAARAYMASTVHVEYARMLAEKADDIANQLPDSSDTERSQKAAVRLDVMMVLAQLSRLHGDVGRALNLYDRADAELQQLHPDSTYTERGAQIRVGRSTALAAVERWDEAIGVLGEGLKSVTGGPSRIALLLEQVRMLLHLGRAEAATPPLSELADHAESSPDRALRSGILVLQAEHASLKGDIGEAIRFYEQALVYAQETNGANRASSIMMQQVLVHLRAVANRNPTAQSLDMPVSFDRPVDLSLDGVPPIDRAQRLEHQALVDRAIRHFGSALLARNLAGDLYWRYGTAEQRAGFDHSVAQQLEEDGDLVSAIVRYARTASVEDITRVGAQLAGRLTSVASIRHLTERLRATDTDSARVGRAAAYAALADVVPDDDLPRVVEDLVHLLNGSDSVETHSAVRGNASKALGRLAPRLTAEQAKVVIEDSLALIERDNWWDTTRSLVVCVGNVLAHQGGLLSVELVDQAVTVLRKCTHAENPILAETAMNALIHAGAAGLLAARAGALAELQARGRNTMAVVQRMVLGDRTAPDEAAAAATALLDAMRTKVERLPSEIRRYSPPYHPDNLRPLASALDDAELRGAVESLTQIVLEPTEFLGTRGRAPREIGVLADRITPREALSLLNMAREVHAGRVSLDRSIAEATKRPDPARAFEETEGDREWLRIGGVWAMFCVYNRVTERARRAFSADIRLALQEALTEEWHTRVATASAIGQIRRASKDIEETIILVLYALLNDSDPAVRAAAVRAAYEYYGRSERVPKRELIERILYLGEHDLDVVVCETVAAHLPQLASIGDAALAQRYAAVRDRLLACPSYQVRMTAALCTAT